jgi:hypothetical protein
MTPDKQPHAQLAYVELESEQIEALRLEAQRREILLGSAQTCNPAMRSYTLGTRAGDGLSLSISSSVVGPIGHEP